MPQPGFFVLHSSAVPPLEAGDYTLTGNQTLTGGATQPYEGHLRVTSPRFRMPPDQILSTYPPANAEGSFETRLPQVVLKRRTLPWERVPGTGVLRPGGPWAIGFIPSELSAPQLPQPPPAAAVGRLLLLRWID